MRVISKDRLTRLCLLLGDILVFNSSIFFAYVLLVIMTDDASNYLPQSLIFNRILVQAGLSILLCGWFLLKLRHYSYRKPFWVELKGILRTLIIFSILDLAITAFSKWGFSRVMWSTTWILIFIFLPIFRFTIKKILIKMNLWQKDTVIVGTGKNAVEVFYALESENLLGYNIKQFVQSGEVSPVFANKGFDSIEIINEEDFFATTYNPHTVFIIALDSEQLILQQNVINRITKQNHRNLHVVPDVRGLPVYGTDMSYIFSHEVMIFRINNNLAKRSSRFFKRTFDLVCATSLVILLSPVLLWIYLSVKKDGGKVIYEHERIGRHGKTFNCLKFRSMVTNSKQVLDELLENDAVARAEWERDFKLRNDPRITKIGAFLRKTSLDELPQLFNVIKGEMSLVGPRPVIQEELERYHDSVNFYLMAKPGMTGLWQVSGRNDTDYDKRVYFDVWYVKNWSLWNDLAILFKTINVVLNRTGAY